MFFIVLRGIALVLSLAVATASPLGPASSFDAEAVPWAGDGEPSGFYRGANDGLELNDAVIPCPQCGSEDVVEIVYGYPTEETLERAEAGEVRLGGCVVGHCDPNRYCNNCGHEWFWQHFGQGEPADTSEFSDVSTDSEFSGELRGILAGYDGEAFTVQDADGMVYTFFFDETFPRSAFDSSLDYGSSVLVTYDGEFDEYGQLIGVFTVSAAS